MDGTKIELKIIKKENKPNERSKIEAQKFKFTFNILREWNFRFLIS